MQRRKHQKGQALVEFVLVGVPALFLSLSIFEISIAMWQYHTLAQVAQTTSRYVTAHGYNCTQNGNTCSITLANIAGSVENSALGLDKSKLKVVFTAASGDTVCNPISSCDSNTSTYPSGSTDGAVGADIKVTASYPVTNPVMMFWPGAANFTSSSLRLTGVSRQRITF